MASRSLSELVGIRQARSLYAASTLLVVGALMWLYHTDSLTSLLISAQSSSGDISSTAVTLVSRLEDIGNAKLGVSQIKYYFCVESNVRVIVRAHSRGKPTRTH
jgi:hypothetical protein